ncbi:MAG TPA: hypothetical protein VEZ90_09040 [Blastocatellia bacterium]|nr:hypothetical protein [Blastocatellia bacterium]
MTSRDRLKVVTVRCIVFISLATLALAAISPKLAFSDRGTQQTKNSGAETKCAETAKEQRELAKEYQAKASEYRKEAESHRQMLADYKKRFARNPKEILENPAVKKMRLHCERYINADEQKAQDADEMARFHILRAEELEGK